MSKPRPLCTGGVLLLFLAISFLAAAMSTRAWFTGYLYISFWTIVYVVKIGLFTLSANGRDYGIGEYFPKDKGDFLNVVVLLCVGAGLLILAATSSLLLLLVKNEKLMVIMLIIFFVSTFPSGVLIIVGSTLFRFTVDDTTSYMKLGYSYYLAMTSGVLAIVAFSLVLSGIKRGEMNSSGTETASVATPTHVQVEAGKV